MQGICWELVRTPSSWGIIRERPSAASITLNEAWYERLLTGAILGREFDDTGTTRERTTQGPYWDHTGSILAPYCDQAGTICDDTATILGPYPEILGPYGTKSGPTGKNSGTILGPKWDHNGTISRPY